MSRAAFVVDTNVLVAGLLTARPTSPVAQVLDAMLAAAFPFAASDALLAEYGTVLSRPRLRRLHGLSAPEVDSLLTELALHAIVLAPVAGPPAPDPGDQLLWDLLATRGDLRLVTGDQALLAHPAYAARVLTPRRFIEAHLHRRPA
ncbi:MAG: putative toxin-antitoxin system toxin component, PIN family [Rubrivivax sp.]